MRLAVSLLVVLGALCPAGCRRMKTGSAQFNRVSTSFNPRTMGFFNFFITPNSDGRSVEMNSLLLVNATEELHVAVNVLMRSQEKDLYRQVVAYDFDFCRLREDFMRQTIAKLWSKNLKKYSNLPLRCPVEAGPYYVKSMRLNSASIPMFLISGQYIVNVVLYIKTGSVQELLTKSSLEVTITMD